MPASLKFLRKKDTPKKAQGSDFDLISVILVLVIIACLMVFFSSLHEIIAMR